MKKIKIEYKNRLPHIAPIGTSFFVTFRLADSLPQSIIWALKKEMNEAITDLKKHKPKGYQAKILEQKKIFFGKYDHQLDHAPYGKCYLKQDKIAQIIKNKLHELDGDKYNLLAYTIMPNHVHILIDTSCQIIDQKGFLLDDATEDFTQLHEIMRLIKGSTAYYANKLLGRTGAFWMKDSYDHYIRNDNDFNNTLKYILLNPVNAGLVEKWEDFPHTYVSKTLL